MARSPSELRYRLVFGFVAALVVAVLLVAAPAQADDIDEAAALPGDQAIDALEKLLEVAKAAGDKDRTYRAHRALGDIHVGRGEPYAALAHFEGRLEAHGNKPEDRIAYAQALLAVAQQNIRGGGMGRNVQPFLRDALDAVQGMRLSRYVDTDTPRPGEPGLPLPPGLRGPLVLVVVETHYLLAELDEASRALDEASVDTQPLIGGLPDEYLRPLRDLRARVRYAQKRFAEAAADWLAVGNAVGAASAYDAARLPQKSIPIYAELIAGTPQDAALLARALAGARFTGAQAALLVALSKIAVPEGPAGTPLLKARAVLLEATSQPAEALATLREVAARTPDDGAALVDIGRLIVVTGDRASDDVWDASAAAYEKAVELDPGSVAAAAGLSFIAGREFGRLWQTWRNPRARDRCLRVQRALVAADPEDSLSLANLGNTQRVLGAQAESLATYDRARAANPFDPGVESDAGLALAGAGEAQKALAAYERSLELDPGHLAGGQNAARALLLAGENDRAEAHLGAAVRTARAVGRSPATYRFLLDRVWRTRKNPKLR